MHHKPSFAWMKTTEIYAFVELKQKFNAGTWILDNWCKTSPWWNDFLWPKNGLIKYWTQTTNLSISSDTRQLYMTCHENLSQWYKYYITNQCHASAVCNNSGKVLPRWSWNKLLVYCMELYTTSGIDGSQGQYSHRDNQSITEPVLRTDTDRYKTRDWFQLQIYFTNQKNSSMFLLSTLFPVWSSIVCDIFCTWLSAVSLFFHNSSS